MQGERLRTPCRAVPARPGSTGDGGNYNLTGGAGLDHLSGGNGNDRLTTRDGPRDYVNCGNGIDLALVDRFDVVGSSCETTHRG